MWPMYKLVSCVHICFKQKFWILNIFLYLFLIQAYLFKQRCILFQGNFFYKTDFTTYWQLDCDIREDEFECFWLQAPYHTHISRQSQISFCCNWPAKYDFTLYQACYNRSSLHTSFWAWQEHTRTKSSQYPC